VIRGRLARSEALHPEHGGCEIVGADAEEVGFARDLRSVLGGFRRLDHRAQSRGFIERRADSGNVGGASHHRQKQPQVEVLSGGG